MWTKSGSTLRKKAGVSEAPPGDFVAPVVYDAAQLGLSNANREIDLWVEGIRPSPSIGGDRILNHRLKVEN